MIPDIIKQEYNLAETTQKFGQLTTGHEIYEIKLKGMPDFVYLYMADCDFKGRSLSLQYMVYVKKGESFETLMVEKKWAQECVAECQKDIIEFATQFIQKQANKRITPR